MTTALSSSSSKKAFANLIGLCAVFLWAAMPTLTTLLIEVPPFLLMGITFGIAFVMLASKEAVQKRSVLHLFQLERKDWLIGIIGLFGTHVFYFSAMHHTATVNVILINNLWPLMVIFLAAYLLRERITPFDLAGLALGLGGIIYFQYAKGNLNGVPEGLLGCLLAFGAALIWSGYSIACRLRAGKMPAHAMVSFYGVSSLLSLLCHSLFEQSVALSLNDWRLLALMGAGPIALSFLAWDYGVKHGDISLLSILCYTCPLFSTSLLIFMGLEPYGSHVPVTLTMVVGAGLLGFAGSLHRQKKTLLPEDIIPEIVPISPAIEPGKAP